jgi:AraC family transcriptional activator of pobA
MKLHTSHEQIPVYSLKADDSGNKQFRIYNYKGDFPDRSEVLVPHRKDYYLLVFIRLGGGRQWIDMNPYTLKDNTIYLMAPNQVIVKEEMVQLTSTGIAFTKDFLAVQENMSLMMLPIIKNPESVHELMLKEKDIVFVEDIIAKITFEYQNPSEWQHQMLGAYLIVLLTYLSRIYSEQLSENDISTDKTLLKNFLTKVNDCFSELHEVSDYASLLNISPGHLSESIKNQSGRPAIKHIHDRLIMESRRLLMHTDSSIKEIAYNLGFTDASYFNRFFKRETGLTPVEYRIDIRRMSH